MNNRQDKIAFLDRVFGGLTLSRDGVNVAVMCPRSTCASRKKGKRKLSIHVDTDQSHCWVCGLKTRNTLIPILRRVCTRLELQEYVRKFTPRNVRLSGIDQENLPAKDRVVLPSRYRLLAMHMRSRDPDVRRAINYMHRRGYTEGDLWRFKVGISDDLGFDRRVIVPSFDADGFLNTWSARAIDKFTLPPYKIPSVERIGIVFNELNIDWSKELVLVEGPMDLMKCVGNATCLQGSSLTENHLLFWRIVSNQTPVVLALDADAKPKTVKIANLLASYGVPLRIMDLGKFSDVGEMDRKSYLEALKNAKSWSSVVGLKMRIETCFSDSSLC